MTPQVMVHVSGSASGEDEIEYCRTRSGERIARNSLNGRATEGLSRRTSNMLVRFAKISVLVGIVEGPLVLNVTTASLGILKCAMIR